MPARLFGRHVGDCTDDYSGLGNLRFAGVAEISVVGMGGVSSDPVSSAIAVTPGIDCFSS